ncbi:serine/threonine-protein kinase [bacterium]|nr:serine/threonine-protein kinase [bacterium]
METSARFEDAYRVGALIANGGFGSVHLCLRVGESAVTTPLVVKTVRFADNTHARRRVDAEPTTLRRLDQCAKQAPHMASMFPSLVDVFFAGGDVKLVMTQCFGNSSKTLHQLRLDASNQKLPESEIKRYASEILKALNYLHSVVKTAHGDVKPENVLVGSDGNIKIALIDFHCSVGLRRGDDIDTSADKIGTLDTHINPNSNPEESSVQVFGTPEYLAPETLDGKSITQKSDLYQLGVLMFDLCFGFSPFASSFGFSQHTFSKIRKGEVRWPGGSSATEYQESKPFIDCVKALIVKEPNARLSFDELKRHEFFAGVEWGESKRR